MSHLWMLPFVLSLSTLASAETMVARDGYGNSIRLLDTACNHAGVLGRLHPSVRADFKNARIMQDGKDIYACWLKDWEGDPFIVTEDGRKSGFYMKDFSKEDL